MLRLRTVLLYRYPYYLFLLSAIFYCILVLVIFPKTTKYQESDRSFQGEILEQMIDGDRLQVTMKGKEPLIGNYYFKTKEEKENYQLTVQPHDTVMVSGTLKKPRGSTIPNTFDYKEYLKEKGIFWTLEIDSITKIKGTNHLLYQMRNQLFAYFDKFPLIEPYLDAFLLGSTKELSSKAVSSYQAIGISHLLAISGSHLTFFSGALLFFLRRLKWREFHQYLGTTLFLTLYFLLVGPVPSMMRAYLFFLLMTINKGHDFHIRSVHLFYVALALCLIYQPGFIYQNGFWYSFIISFYLIFFNDWLNEKKNPLKGMILSSIICFVASVPITLLTNNQVNFLSILYNLFYIPYVTYIVFPGSLLVAFFPFLGGLYHILIIVLEESASFLASIPFGTVTFFHLPGLLPIYYVVGSLFLFGLRYHVRNWVIGYFLLFCMHSLVYDPRCYVMMIDVGQGDAILLHDGRTNILIDTGGKLTFHREDFQMRSRGTSLSEKTILPYFKSQAIRQLDALITTHGDEDHMGEAVSILQKIPVRHLYLNEGSFSALEQKTIQVAVSKNVPWSLFTERKTLQIGAFSFQSLNHGYEDENDSSLVLLVSCYDKLLLFTGDASIKSEQEIMKRYQLPKVNLLKVAHHGSRTSTSATFLKTIMPEYALISMGVDNQFSHPHSEVIERLQLVTKDLFMTKEVGSIQYFIKTGTFSFDPP